MVLMLAGRTISISLRDVLELQDKILTLPLDFETPISYMEQIFFRLMGFIM